MINFTKAELDTLLELVLDTYEEIAEAIDEKSLFEFETDYQKELTKIADKIMEEKENGK